MADIGFHHDLQAGILRLEERETRTQSLAYNVAMLPLDIPVSREIQDMCHRSMSVFLHCRRDLSSHIGAQLAKAEGLKIIAVSTAPGSKGLVTLWGSAAELILFVD
ncbi:hypothetical protein L226DRAFT_574417 [Lentinus tigrinus ALCF2SS1-7]|nr:hypothetical protein L226DRAFT_574417 [Lentinus tigrinus ALCF2SS1-7]